MRFIRLKEQFIVSAGNADLVADLVAEYQFTAQMANSALRRGDMEAYEEFRAAHQITEHKLHKIGDVHPAVSRAATARHGEGQGHKPRHAE